MSPERMNRARNRHERAACGRNVILASGSPRRQELLKKIIPRFAVIPSRIEEEAFRVADPAAFARKAAEAKARAVAERHPEALVIAADTLVSLGSNIFGKPGNRREARAMLRKLSGKEHAVITAVAVTCWRTGKMLTGLATSRVTFKSLGGQEIERYLDRVEHLDKAGAYAIQESGDALVDKLEGDFDNVVGLPVGLVRDLLAQFGVR